MTNRLAPGWWMIPGAVLGLAVYALAGVKLLTILVL